MFQCGERKNWIIFTKVETKMRQKLEYKDQIETEEMTPGIILTCGIITITSLCHCHVAQRPFARGNFFKIQKINK